MASPNFSWNAKTEKQKQSRADFSRVVTPTKPKEFTRQERLNKGLPVSVNKNKAAPTKAGGILRDVLRAPATLLVRPGQALASAKGFTEDEQTVKSKFFGDIKTSSNWKDVVKDIGRGMETVSLGVGVGAVKNIGANVAKESIKTVAKRAAIEGAAGGFVGSTGAGISQGKKGWELAQDALIGTAAGGILGGVIGGAGQKVFGKSSARVANKVDNVVPEASVKEATTVRRGTNPNPMNREKVSYEPYTPDSELPTIEMGSKPRSPLPVIQTKPVAQKAPGDFTYEPVKNPSQVTMPKTVSNGVATKGSNGTVSNKTSTTSVAKPFTESGSKVPVAKPFVDNAAPKQKTRVSKSDFEQSSFENTTWEREAKLFSELTDDEVDKIATGKMQPKNGASSAYVWKEAKLKAIEAGDIDKIRDLADSPVGSSKAGQDLQFAKDAKMANDPVEAIQAIQEARRSKLDTRVLKRLKKKQGEY